MDFLSQIFEAMNMQVNITAAYNEEEQELSLNLEGDDMGILIGKRGQTLDSLQYLVSLIVNKGTEGYLRVKLDTENYRERRKETLETLAKNIAYKVKRTKRPREQPGQYQDPPQKGAHLNIHVEEGCEYKSQYKVASNHGHCKHQGLPQAVQE